MLVGYFNDDTPLEEQYLLLTVVPRTNLLRDTGGGWCRYSVSSYLWDFALITATHRLSYVLVLHFSSLVTTECTFLVGTFDRQPDIDVRNGHSR